MLIENTLVHAYGGCCTTGNIFKIIWSYRCSLNRYIIATIIEGLEIRRIYFKLGYEQSEKNLKAKSSLHKCEGTLLVVYE